MSGILQQLGLLISKCLQYQFFLGGKESVENGLGDAHFFTQDINATVDQPPVHNTLDYCGQQSIPHLLPLLFRIGFSSHILLAPFRMYKEQKKKIVFI